MKHILIFLLPFVAGIVTDQLLIERPAQAQKSVETPAGGSRPSLTIGYTNVTVGMPKEEALAALSASYNIVQRNDGQRSTIMDKPIIRNGVADYTYTHVPGSVTFENGAVTEISRNWGEGQSGPAVESLWGSFWGAVTSTIPDNNERYVTVLLKAYSTKTPAYQAQTIDVRLNSHRLISISRGAFEARPVGEPSARMLANVSVEETVF